MCCRAGDLPDSFARCPQHTTLNTAISVIVRSSFLACAAGSRVLSDHLSNLAESRMSPPLIALFIAAFAFGTTEFVIAGVLPEVAEGLRVSVPAAGYLVTAYALGIAIGG